jgi:hypothetical protein
MLTIKFNRFFILYIIFHLIYLNDNKTHANFFVLNIFFFKKNHDQCMGFGQQSRLLITRVKLFFYFKLNKKTDHR